MASEYDEKFKYFEGRSAEDTGGSQAARKTGGRGIFKQAAETVLKRKRVLMGSKEITREALGLGLLSGPDGKPLTGRTPENTMTSALYMDTNRPNSIFCKGKPKSGEFGLKEWKHDRILCKLFHRAEVAPERDAKKRRLMNPPSDSFSLQETEKEKTVTSKATVQRRVGTRYSMRVGTRTVQTETSECTDPQGYPRIQTPQYPAGDDECKNDFKIPLHPPLLELLEAAERMEAKSSPDHASPTTTEEFTECGDKSDARLSEDDASTPSTSKPAVDALSGDSICFSENGFKVFEQTPFSSAFSPEQHIPGDLAEVISNLLNTGKGYKGFLVRQLKAYDPKDPSPIPLAKLWLMCYEICELLNIDADVSQAVCEKAWKVFIKNGVRTSSIFQFYALGVQVSALLHGLSCEQ